jgi:hypothetical protein
MFKYLIAIAAVAAGIAYGVDQLADKGTSNGPTVVTVQVPNPMGGGGGNGGGAIYIP